MILVLICTLTATGCMVDFTGGVRDDGGPGPDAADAADGAVGCGPDNCEGCCDLLGDCRLGDTENHCGTAGAICRDCTLTAGQLCIEHDCEVPGCVDADSDGYGAYCAAGEDECDDDPSNWTAAGCADCADTDGDGQRGTNCDLSEDACEGDANNWTAAGCTGCSDSDGDGLRGTDCDLPEDCDDNALGVAVACQANGCPEGWIHIPAGSFEMGCNAGELGNTCDNDEQPRHTVTLTDYCIQPTEVSVGMYRACDQANVCSGDPEVTATHALCNWTWSAGGRESHPLNCIRWADARAYCQDWMGGDFPTEAQWEKAARGDTDTRKYPWGDTPEPNCNHCNWNQCHSSTAPSTWPVGTLSSLAGDSPYGLKDMAGNLWEMTRDTFDADIYVDCFNGCTDPVNASSDTSKVIRGGGYYQPDASYLRVTERSMENSTSRSLNLGFRCRRTP